MVILHGEERGLISRTAAGDRPQEKEWSWEWGYRGLLQKTLQRLCKQPEASGRSRKCGNWPLTRKWLKCRPIFFSRRASLLRRHSLRLVMQSSSHGTSAEAKETFVVLCLLLFRSKLRTFDPEKFIGYRRGLSTININYGRFKYTLFFNIRTNLIRTLRLKSLEK